MTTRKDFLTDNQKKVLTNQLEMRTLRAECYSSSIFRKWFVASVTKNNLHLKFLDDNYATTSKKLSQPNSVQQILTVVYRRLALPTRCVTLSFHHIFQPGCQSKENCFTGEVCMRVSESDPYGMCKVSRKIKLQLNKEIK